VADEHKTKFDEYVVRYLSGGGTGPEIECLHRGDPVGTLHFHDEGAQLPANELVRPEDGGPMCRLHFRLSQFPHLIDLLREEKPLYLWFSEASAQGAVMTGAEPVGEGEPYLSR
jgi:hypothetical protein